MLCGFHSDVSMPATVVLTVCVLTFAIASIMQELMRLQSSCHKLLPLPNVMNLLVWHYTVYTFVPLFIV